jgi:hypothetical protein
MRQISRSHNDGIDEVNLVQMDNIRVYQSTASTQSSLKAAIRKPQRLTITVPWSTYQALIATSDEQGRSLSNTAAYWLERQADAMRQQGA